MLGYKPTFSVANVQSISIRSDSVFKRKTLTVKNGQDKVTNYYMYYQLSEASPKKLFACACKGSSGSSKS